MRPALHADRDSALQQTATGKRDVHLRTPHATKQRAEVVSASGGVREFAEIAGLCEKATVGFVR